MHCDILKKKNYFSCLGLRPGLIFAMLMLIGGQGMVIDSALAIPMSADWLDSSGVNHADALTRDSDTGLEWLDLTFTLNRTPGAVGGLFGSGDEFEGFRFATRQEATQLFADFGLPTLPDPAARFSEVTFNTAFSNSDFLTFFPRFQTLQSLLGFATASSFAQTTMTSAGFALNSAADLLISQGFTLGKLDASIQHNTSLASTLAGVSGVSYKNTTNGGTFADHDPGTGSFLVRTAAPSSSIPEPDTAAIFLLGLLGIAGLAALRRRRSWVTT